MILILQMRKPWHSDFLQVTQWVNVEDEIISQKLTLLVTSDSKHKENKWNKHNFTELKYEQRKLKYTKWRNTNFQLYCPREKKCRSHPSVWKTCFATLICHNNIDLYLWNYFSKALCLKLGHTNLLITDGDICYELSIQNIRFLLP